MSSPTDAFDLKEVYDVSDDRVLNRATLLEKEGTFVWYHHGYDTFITLYETPKLYDQGFEVRVPCLICNQMQIKSQE